MESIITDIVKIIKFENNVIAREKELMCYFFDLIRELMKLALEEVDAGLVEKTKNWGRASFRKAHGIEYLNVMGWMQGAGDGTFYGPHTENGQPVLVIAEGGITVLLGRVHNLLSNISIRSLKTCIIKVMNR